MRRAPERLETARLVLERARPEDEADLSGMLRDPHVAASLTDDGRPPSADRVRRQLAAKVAHWDSQGYGLWTARERATGTLVGRGGLQLALLPGVDEVEAAWTIVADRWGEGLAGELAAACVTVAFDVLELPRIIAYTQPTNAASRRVMEKAGFEFARNVQHHGRPCVLYVRDRC